ncbi:MAG: hypothetical protein KJZ69_10525 [Phycisphaerales bacterium]|nr:hypothetical protein [Phycisphaerales bacterium]
MRRSFLAVAVAAASALAAPTFAQTIIDTYPYWDNNITNGWPRMAQSFVAPTDNTLDNYKFGFAGSGVTIQVDVYQWDDNVGEVGPSLYSTQVTGNPGDITISNINLTLTPGTTYALVFDFQGYSGQSIHWMQNNTGNPGGHSSWWNGGWQYLRSGWSTQFRAEFRGGGFNIRLTGQCPGQKTLSWSGAGSGQMGIILGNGPGNYTIPGGPCQGTQLGLSGPGGLQLYNIIGTNGGQGQVTATVGTGACGKWVQCIKTNDCSTSNATGPI